eukprot:Amastigsp_a341705_33.p5 type:complete len:147 gc:universal Amastigsp_a341705_33:812-372(-)
MHRPARLLHNARPRPRVRGPRPQGRRADGPSRRNHAFEDRPARPRLHLCRRLVARCKRRPQLAHNLTPPHRKVVLPLGHTVRALARRGRRRLVRSGRHDIRLGRLGLVGWPPNNLPPRAQGPRPRRRSAQSDVHKASAPRVRRRRD